MKKQINDRSKLIFIGLIGVFILGFLIASAATSDQNFFAETKRFFLGEEEIVEVPTVSYRGNNPQAAATVTDQDYIAGDPEKARLILVEYMDLNCIYCGRFHQTLKEVVEEFDGQVSWVIRHYPLMGSELEAQAAECVGQTAGNDKFFTFVENYFENLIPANTSQEEKKAELIRRAEAVQADITECLESGQAAEKVKSQSENAAEIGLQGTPSTVLIFPETGEREVLAGAYSTEDMIEILGTYLR